VKREEKSGPLGVIDCLMAGFEVVGRHLWLIALPVLLDLLLWLGPRLSIAPLSQGLVALLRSQPVYSAEMSHQVSQATQFLEQFGEQFNLFSLLSALPLFNLPSLLARRAVMTSPLSEPRVLGVDNVLVLIIWSGALVVVGLLLGFLYLNSLARRVRDMQLVEEREGRPTPGAGAKDRERTQKLPATGGVGKLIRLFLFASGLLGTGMVLAPLWVALVGIAMAMGQVLGMITWAIGVGVAGYIVLHLLFVVHGVLLGGRGLAQAIWESAVMIHLHLPYVIVMIVVAVVVYEGLGYAWTLPSGDSWLLLVGVLGNSCIATALVAATFVFYKERVDLLPEARQVSVRT